MSDFPEPPPSGWAQPAGPPPAAPPPGYVAYGDTGAVNRRVQPTGGISKALGVLVAIYIPLSVLGIISAIRLAHRAREFLDGERSLDSFRDSLGVNGGGILGILGGLGGLVMLAIAVLTMIWMFKMAKNVRAIGRQGLRFAPGWAIGGWFVPPCVLYVVPWLMFRELWKASDPDATHAEDWRQVKVAPIVNAWWVLYGLVPIAGVFNSAGPASVFQKTDTESAARDHGRAARFAPGAQRGHRHRADPGDHRLPDAGAPAGSPPPAGDG